MRACQQCLRVQVHLSCLYCNIYLLYRASGMFLPGFAAEVVSVSISPDLAQLTVNWALCDDRQEMDPTVVKLFEGVTAQQMPALEAKILKMVCCLAAAQSDNKIETLSI
jgi:hypothetical protein